ncbi:amidophosphoribosyltransferase [Stutzerimonas stutzeri]|uniref:Amidophosphoribosyltransferase n=1 Tax=Stutzerimonas stutzeri TaxID=316 RepID=A0A2S4AK79_STUST|nr:ComF family protein [Stutzerimonas stutzeri]MCQ4264848.1 ComF family protein [Stutzerimonas stutzeri]POH81893.1 amidophosphoribosyltransferase [Stutzerimonas stutzeri]
MVYNWSINIQNCLLCDEPCDGHPLCGPCEAELPWLDGRCATCAVPLPTHGLVCGECQKRPPSYDHVEVPWRFAFPVDALITRFKHQARWPFGRLLGERLGLHLQHAFTDGLPQPDLLVPVPLARRRLRQRGFNQAQMLAQWLGGALTLPVDEHLLERVVDTPPQQQLDAATRRRNLRQAFCLAPGTDIKGRHLALIDDVLTTGATAEALARLLKRAGAVRVDVYCLARTPKPGD